MLWSIKKKLRPSKPIVVVIIVGEIDQQILDNKILITMGQLLYLELDLNTYLVIQFHPPPKEEVVLTKNWL
jgi:hypothetical protein